MTGFFALPLSDEIQNMHYASYNRLVILCFIIVIILVTESVLIRIPCSNKKALKSVSETCRCPAYKHTQLLVTPQAFTQGSRSVDNSTAHFCT